MFHRVSIRVPSGTKATYLQLFSQVALFDTIAFPNLEDNSHLARWTLESKYVGCFPQHGGFVNFLDDFVGSCVNETSWADLKWSDYLHELPKKGSVLSRAARLFFGGISNVARTPGASRPAVLCIWACWEGWKWLWHFLAVLCLYISHRPPRATHVHCIALQEQCLGQQIPDSVKTNAEPHTSSSSTWWNQYSKKPSWILRHQEKLGQHNHINVTSMKNRRKTPQPFEAQTAPLAMPQTLVPCCLARSCLLRVMFWHDIVTTNDGHWCWQPTPIFKPLSLQTLEHQEHSSSRGAFRYFRTYFASSRHLWWFHSKIWWKSKFKALVARRFPESRT